jgi:ribosome-associated translation inhibitor RaiA
MYFSPVKGRGILTDLKKNYMTIEIHAPHKNIEESFLQSVKQRLLKIYQADKDISRAEIFFHDSKNQSQGAKTCDLRISIFKDNIFISRTGVNYENAVDEVLKELESLLKERNLSDHLQDDITSTVDV